MSHSYSEDSPQPSRVESIDFLRGLVMIIMALDHVRMYFALGTWYAEPTNLATTTPLLFFTRWITHFCAPVFVFLAGTSAFMVGTKKANKIELSTFLFTRGLWFVIAEVIVVNFAWKFDITCSSIILQVIWAIGISMIFLSGLIFLSDRVILIIGLLLVFGHNLLDGIRVQGNGFFDRVWYILHQPNAIIFGDRVIDAYYPVLPLIGLIALGYVCGNLYKKEFPANQRKLYLFSIGIGATLLFIFLRSQNLYGEPTTWQTQTTQVFTWMSFLNVTKYPLSLHFMLMTIGPALIFLSLTDSLTPKSSHPLLTFGRVPFFFYILHLFLIHALAMISLIASGRDWHEYILTISALRSGTLINFGFELWVVYVVWIFVLVILYPLCLWYQKYKENHPKQWWLSYI